ncbi:anaerobic C4-dicarboxylate transporter family protein [Hydrogenophaga sp. 2FB]|uniref:anaerobic C4-dicarboxylate transporter family protein n=1 Tax=Hydrogenophaga sp. 2FB TaxID=2502187 RepID=UPI0010F553C8|nr:anaerobic C4-dicarboxylate transporter family protein [Hydrogenophaga sp. 2FB]
MNTLLIVVQGLMLLGLIAVGVHYKGMAIGLFGAVGVLLFVLLFDVAPGSVPVSAMLIIMSVVTAAGAMQLAGGIDFLVAQAQKVIRRFPNQITYVAPLTTFAFCAGAGTGNIYYSLMPVIYEVALANKVRPERPLALSATAGQLAITASPVSAAMAAMVGLLAPTGFKISDILMITVPASIVAILIGGFVMSRVGKPLEQDPEYQRRVASGELTPPAADTELKAPTREGKISALLFLTGVLFIIAAGIFPELRPQVTVRGALVGVDLSQLIQITMLTVAAAIVMFARIKASDIVKSSLFDSGMVAVVALFGVAWMANTFIAAHERVIVDGLGSLAQQAPVMIAVALFAVAAMTTSQSSATFSIIPIGIALGLQPATLAAMWPAVVGVFLLPTNGSQIATVELDRTGSTRIGRAVINHSFLLPTLLYAVVAVGLGLLISRFVG